MKILTEKLHKLQEIIIEMKSVVVAFSGGVDSTLLLDVAKEVLPGKVLAVTAVSETYPERETLEAKAIATEMNVPLEVITTSELQDEKFVNNPPERCYYCKKELFAKIWSLAQNKGYQQVIDGANIDDCKDFRPGMKAGRELGVRSPLQEAELSKEEIRKLSRQRNLPTWNKPSYACLASRFPYHTKITREDLVRLYHMEEFLNQLGFSGFRARFHQQIIRIEVAPIQMEKLLQNREAVIKKSKELGFIYITMDLEGYRTGSMNEVL